MSTKPKSFFQGLYQLLLGHARPSRGGCIRARRTLRHGIRTALPTAGAECPVWVDAADFRADPRCRLRQCQVHLPPLQQDRAAEAEVVWPAVADAAQVAADADTQSRRSTRAIL